MAMIGALEGKPWYYGLVAGAVLGILVYGLGWWAYFAPMKEEIVQKDGRLAQLQQKIQEGRAAQQRLPQFREEVRRLELELEKLLRILPARLNTEDLLRRIRALAEQGNLDLLRIRPGRLTDQEFYRIWPITINMNGTYHDLAIFFDRIGRFSRIINIDNLSIQALGARGRGKTIATSFVARTFIYREPKK